jgi:hypothetical protein
MPCNFNDNVVSDLKLHNVKVFADLINPRPFFTSAVEGNQGLVELCKHFEPASEEKNSQRFIFLQSTGIHLFPDLYLITKIFNCRHRYA